jgi:hypothetical protein
MMMETDKKKKREGAITSGGYVGVWQTYDLTKMSQGVTNVDPT